MQTGISFAKSNQEACSVANQSNNVVSLSTTIVPRAFLFHFEYGKMVASMNKEVQDVTSNINLQTPSRKRPRTPAASISKTAVVDLTNEEDEAITRSLKKRKTASPSKAKNEEKRLRVFRKHAPQSYLEKLSRAQSQRYAALSQPSMKELG